jgi:CelD/BcsL family acetyltransferase involved in cellulose biosynthesis
MQMHQAPVAAQTCRCDMLDAAALQRLDPAQWHRLSADALDPNPFYARAYVLAGLACLDEDAGLRALAIRTEAEGRLVGLFLYHRRAFRTARGALNRYQMSGVPLLDRADAPAAVDAWFAAMARGAAPAQWQLPHLDLESGFARLCRARLERHGMHLEPLAGYDRPRLTRNTGGFAAHVQTVLDRKRHKELQRSLRRLREQGELRFERVTDAGMLGQRLEDFLAIEHAGWKGRAGTSFLSDPSHARFLREAVLGNPAASIDGLLLDGQPIALSLNLSASGTLFTPKCAYDEAFRRYSPGLLLEYLVIEAFYADDAIAQMDAATTVGGHLVGTFWNAQRPMASVLIGRRGWQTSLLASFARARLAGRAGARQLLGQPGLALARQVRRAAPDLLRRLAQFGQSIGCLLLAV